MTIRLAGVLSRVARLRGVLSRVVRLRGVIGVFVPGPAPIARSLDFSDADNSQYLALF